MQLEVKQLELLAVWISDQDEFDVGIVQIKSA